MKVLVVDDHPVVIAACRALVAQDDIELVEARDADSGYLRYLATQPAVAVIDISLPGLSGFDLLKRILAYDPDARIIMFSMSRDPVFARRSFEAGAKGFLSKSDDPADFIHAVRAVATGGLFGIADAGELAQARECGHLLTALSIREIEILRHLGSGRGIDDIARLVRVSPKTISNACSMMKQKLAVRSGGDLVRLAREFGLAD